MQSIPAGPEDNQDASETYQNGAPPPPSDPFGQQNWRQRGDEYRPDKGNGHGVRQGHQAQAVDEQEGRGNHQDRAEQLHLGVTDLEYIELAAP